MKARELFFFSSLVWFESFCLLFHLLGKAMTRKLFGAVSEAPTLGQELMLTEVLWAPFGLLPASVDTFG